MTRDEAMREVTRTTEFEFAGERVVVRSVRLLAAIDRLREAERDAFVPTIASIVTIEAHAA